jgi:hypothetical protein
LYLRHFFDKIFITASLPYSIKTIKKWSVLLLAQSRDHLISVQETNARVLGEAQRLHQEQSRKAMRKMKFVASPIPAVDESTGNTLTLKVRLVPNFVV